MKLRCLNCNHEFEGTISRDELGWHSVCPECESNYYVDSVEVTEIRKENDYDSKRV